VCLAWSRITHTHAHTHTLKCAGHVHTYYRSCPLEADECTDDTGDGVTHFVAGTGGHELTAVEDGERSDTWLEKGVNDYGFLRFDVGRDSLHAQFITTSDGESARVILTVGLKHGF